MITQPVLKIEGLDFQIHSQILLIFLGLCPFLSRQAVAKDKAGYSVLSRVFIFTE